MFSGESVFIETYNHAIIGCIYKSPRSSISDLNSHLADAFDIISKERKNCYEMGDFNIKYHVFTLFSSCDFQPTRVTETSATLIDNVFTNILDKKMNSGILCMDISDNFPIFLMTFIHATIMNIDSNPTTYRVIKPSTINKFKELVEHLSWDTVLDHDDPQQAYTLLINEISKIYNVAFPEKRKFSKSHSKPTKPWVT